MRGDSGPLYGGGEVVWHGAMCFRATLHSLWLLVLAEGIQRMLQESYTAVWFGGQYINVHLVC